MGIGRAHVARPNWRHSFMTALLRYHDRITYALFVIGVTLIGLIGVLYVYEVSSRYLFNAPTDWGN